MLRRRAEKKQLWAAYQVRSYLVRPCQPGAVTARRCGHDQMPRALGEAGDERFALGAVFVDQLPLCCRHAHDLDLRVGLDPFFKAAWGIMTRPRLARTSLRE